MTRNELLYTTYTDQAFDRWLKANVAIGSIFAAAVVVMALAGSKVGTMQAVAQEAQATELSASAKIDQARMLSSYELTVQIAPDGLPVMQVDQPF